MQFREAGTCHSKPKTTLLGITSIHNLPDKRKPAQSTNMKFKLLDKFYQSIFRYVSVCYTNNV